MSASRPDWIPPVRALRELHGLTLEELAGRTGLDLGLLSRLETGERRLGLQHLLPIARALGLRELEKALRPFVEPGEEGP